MSGIENTVADSLISLAYGHPQCLTSFGGDKIAAWATTVAMLRATQVPGRPALTEADARTLRETSAPPPGYFVWLVSGEERWDFASRHSRLTVKGRDAHLTWFWLGRAVFMVADSMLAPYFDVHESMPGCFQLLYPQAIQRPQRAYWPQWDAITREQLVAVTAFGLSADG